MKKHIAISAAAVVMASALALVGCRSQKDKALAAETASRIVSLTDAVPPYYAAYFTEESVAALDKSLAAVPQQIATFTAESDDLPKTAALQEIYDHLAQALDELEYQHAGCDRFFINTEEGNGNRLKKDDGYVNAEVILVNANGDVLDETGRIKVRGNSTAKGNKKPFKIKYDEKQNVLDMGTFKNWVLLANCYDPTMLRNRIMFDFSRQLGLEYVPQDRFVELWLDGKFKGCYQVTEPVEVKKNRLNLDVESNAGCRDFLIEVEAEREEEDGKYLLHDDLRFSVKEPEPETLTEEQLAYITPIFDNWIDTVKSGNQENISALIDMESFAKMYIIDEFCKNVDTGFSSAFFYYRADENKFYAGPPWDFDLTLGNLFVAMDQEKYTVCYNPEGTYAADEQLFAYLTKQAWFMDEVKRIYADNRDYIKNIYAPGGLIDTTIAENEDMITRNRTEAGWNPASKQRGGMRVPDATYELNVEYLRRWCQIRDEWLTDHWGLTA